MRTLHLLPVLFLGVLLAPACTSNIAEDGSSGSMGGGSPFACGTTTCSAGFYCEDHPPGIAWPDGGVPADAYTCSPLPAACASNPTCACIEATLPQGDSCSPGAGATCTKDASGNITIVCLDA